MPGTVLSLSRGPLLTNVFFETRCCAITIREAATRGGVLVGYAKGDRRPAKSKTVKVRKKSAKAPKRKRQAKKRQAKSSDGAFSAIPKPELVFALVGAVGTELDLVTNVLQEELDNVGYKSSLVRLSELLPLFEQYKELPSTPKEARYHAYMTAGNGVREDLRRGDAMALFGVAAIRETRKSITGDHTKPDDRGRAYIIRSLKHPKEVETLRSVYGRAFFLIGAYSSKSERLDRLTRSISESHHDFDIEKYRKDAEELIHRDEQETSKSLGQNVRNTFPLSDVFVLADKKNTVKSHAGRFVQIIFGDSFQTPTREEQSMFFAQAAALRSADLNRQVGAAIASRDGEVLAVGCNEVPKAGGGLYWTGDKGDARDHQIGEDVSYGLRKQMLAEIFFRLQQRGWLSRDKTKVDVEKLVAESISEDPSPVLKGSQLMSIIEFGRTVHAEMAAITEASKRGVSLEGATLYTTTFPCHLCARHIVSSGIERVVYIEPYPKSKLRELYPDSTELDGEVNRERVVLFEPFVGVAPRQYMDLFEALERKQNDGVKEWMPNVALPRLRRFVESYIQIETAALELLNQILDERPLRTAKELGIKLDQ